MGQTSNNRPDRFWPRVAATLSVVLRPLEPGWPGRSSHPKTCWRCPQVRNRQKCRAGELRSSRPMLRRLQKRPQGRSVDLSGTASTSLKEYRTVPRPPVRGASCRPPVRNPGKGFAMRCNMAACVQRMTRLTLIPMERTWRTPTRTHLCSIAVQPPRCLAKTVCA